VRSGPRLFPFIFVVVAVSGLILSAQPPAPEPPLFRVGVDAVRMDVVVTDRDGRPVTDLTAQDFEVRQDDKIQQVTLARYVAVDAVPRTALGSRSLPALGATPAPVVGSARPARADVQRTIVLVVDDLGIAWENMEPTRRALRRFVAEHVLPNDLVALVKTSINAGLGQQLTLDRRVLNAAIEEVKWNGFSRREVASFTPLNATVPLSAGGPGPAGFRDPMDFGRLDNLREAMSSAGTLGMLQMAIHGVRDLPGRKAVVLISEGFELFERDPDGTFQPSVLVSDRLQRVADLAMRRGVVVYTLDPRGLVTAGLSAADNTALMGTADVPPAAANRRRLMLET
jgi:VWFA-related protein